MTVVYFVRHAEPDHHWENDRTRPLSIAGIHDREAVAEFFKNKEINYFISSPYKRSIDTIKPTADYFNQNIEADERLRERKAGPESNNEEMFYKRWKDLSFHEPEGESILEVQKRNIESFFEILNKENGNSIVLGTHGTALSSILNYFDPNFGCNDFLRIINYMPYIVRMDFKGKDLIEKKEELIIEKEF